MRTVHRHNIEITGSEQRIASHDDMEPIHFGLQTARGEWSLWVEVDDTSPSQHYFFQLIPTGGPVPPGSKHIGTGVMLDGFHVFHLYQLP